MALQEPGISRGADCGKDPDEGNAAAGQRGTTARLGDALYQWSGDLFLYPTMHAASTVIR